MLAHILRMKQFFAALLGLVLLGVPVHAAGPVSAHARVVRDHYVEVKAYPDYQRRPWPMPGWGTFGNKVQLVGDRYVNVKKTQAGGSTGTVFRPNYDLVTGGTDQDFDELLVRIKAADPKLFVWNLGGYVWTMNPGGFVKYKRLEQLQSVLGEQFLGSDIGEQDGHYANGYREITRLTDDPFEEHLKIHAIQQRVAEDHADKSSLLTVMYNWHDMLRDGAVVSAAAECQNRGGVTGAQIQYAFLRGASRQFGVTLSGDISVFTSWDKHWTSLALRRRMLYSEYQWNTAILSCEDAYGPAPIVADLNSWMQGFLKEYPRPGPVQCPVALLTDPFQGWIPSQTHIGQFKKHVQMAYGPGDFLTHLLFNRIYPKYYDNGAWKNESRAVVPTPYGDLAEVITIDCPGPVLNGYGAVIAASDLPTAGAELRDLLDAYVAGGGRLVITAANARRLWPEWKIRDAVKSFSNGSEVESGKDGEKLIEPLAFDVWSLDPTIISGALVTVAAEDGTPLVLEIPRGKGGITLLASAYGLNSKPVPVVDRPCPLWKQKLDSAPEQVQPYALLEHVRKVVDATLKSQQLFTVGNNELAFIVNRMGLDTYLIGIYNSQLTQQSFRIESYIGGITSGREIPLDDLAKKYPFLPEGYPGDGKPSNPSAIAAGDVRFFKVTVKPAAQPVKVLAHPVFGARPNNRCVRMPTLADLQRALLRWPTFFQHLGGVMLDASEFRDIDADALRYDGSRWLNRQKLGFIVDFRTAQKDGSLRLDRAAREQDIGLLKPVIEKLDILDNARSLLFSASTAAEVEALAVIAGVSAFSNERFHVLPLTAAARQALGSGGGRLLVACTDAAPVKPKDPARAGLMLMVPNSTAVDHKGTAGYPGVQVLDASYADWDALYSDLKNAWERPGAAPMAGKPVARRGVTGTASPVRSNIYLALRDPGSVERALQDLDPVWKDFAGVKLESSLVWQMSPEACRRLGEKLKQLGLKVMVDFSDHLNGWTGLTFQDLSARMKTPDIGNHARSVRVFASVAEKMPLLGAKDALIVMSPATRLKPKGGSKDTECQANRACFDECCRLLRDQGVTPHLWFNPYRGMTRAELLDLVKGTPGAKAALNLNADPDLEGGIRWAGQDLGMIVLGGGSFALQARNSIKTSSPCDALMYAPLSLRTIPLGRLPENVPLVLDGDYHNAAEIRADLAKLSNGK
jgi:hypothetical protein